MKIEEIQRKIGKKFIVPFIDDNMIKHSILTLKDVREFENRKLCYFEEVPLICNYNIMKETDESNTTV